MCQSLSHRRVSQQQQRSSSSSSSTVERVQCLDVCSASLSCGTKPYCRYTHARTHSHTHAQNAALTIVFHFVLFISAAQIFSAPFSCCCNECQGGPDDGQTAVPADDEGINICRSVTKSFPCFHAFSHLHANKFPCMIFIHLSTCFVYVEKSARCCYKKVLPIFHLCMFLCVYLYVWVGEGGVEVQWLCRVQFPIVWNLSWLLV